MIDFHSHVLPGIDDGSKDVTESLALLGLLKEQGIQAVAATSHFYADRESLDSFLSRRAMASKKLTEAMPDGMPKILLGAELYYYPGVSRLEGIESLCLDGTKLLLLEMPMTRWSAYAIKELSELSTRSGFTVVLAHMERYMGFQSRDILKQIYASGIMIQCNADFFIRRTTRRRAISMLRDGKIQFIGSDCHDLKHRPPRIGEALAIVKKKCGEHFMKDIEHYWLKKLNLQPEK